MHYSPIRYAIKHSTSMCLSILLAFIRSQDQTQSVLQLHLVKIF